MADYRGDFYCMLCNSQYETREEMMQCAKRHATPRMILCGHSHWDYGERYPKEVCVLFRDGQIASYKLNPLYAEINKRRR